MNKKRVLAAGGAAAVSLLMAGTAFAATPITATTTSTTNSHWSKGTHKMPGVRGTVSAINGDTLTVTGKNGTTYTVDAANATLQKGFGKTATTITLSNVAVNDTVAVRGTVSGDSVTATKIIDGPIVERQKLANAAFGTVASVNGSSFTLTRKTKTGTSTVTIGTDSTTTFKKNGKADSLSDVVVGQRIVAMGTKDSSGNIAEATSVNILVHAAHTHRTASTTPAT